MPIRSFRTSPLLLFVYALQPKLVGEDVTWGLLWQLDVSVLRAPSVHALWHIESDHRISEAWQCFVGDRQRQELNIE